jgi:hypothetical protein
MAGKHMGNAVAHGARAYNADGLDLHAGLTLEVETYECSRVEVRKEQLAVSI